MLRQDSLRSWWFFIGLNAPAFSVAMIHIVNNPNLYHYVLTRFVEMGLLDDNRLNTALGMLGVIGLLIAGLVQPIIGLLSDRTSSRLGARYPYFIGGALLTTIALWMVVNSASWLILMLAVLIIQIGLNSVQSPLNALIPDRVAPRNMGVAASIKTVLELSGIIGSGLVVWLFLGTNTRPLATVLVVSVIFFVTILLTIWAAPPQPTQSPKGILRPSDRYRRRYGQLVRNRLKIRLSLWRDDLHHLTRQRELLWWFLSRFLFYASFNTIGKFAVTYLTDVYGYTGEEARAIQGRVLAITGILIFIVTLVAGILADRFQRQYIAFFGGLIAAGASLIMVQSPQFTLAATLIGIIGIGSSVFLSTGWALITNIIPAREAAFYLGIANLATALGGAMGLLGGYMIDRVNDYARSSVAGYQVLFILTTLCFALGALAILRVNTPHRRQRTPMERT